MLYRPLQTPFTAVCRHTSLSVSHQQGIPSVCIRYFLLNVLLDSVDYLKFAKWAQHFMQSEVSPPAGPVVHTSQHRWKCFSADGSVTDTENNLAGRGPSAEGGVTLTRWFLWTGGRQTHSL